MSNFHALLFNLGGRKRVEGRTPGCYRIATELRSEGWDVEVVEYFYYWTFEELVQFSKSRITKNTKFIGFSQIFTEWPELAETFCQWLKITYPDIKLIFGSSSYEKLDTKCIDYYVKGYAENSVKKLLQYLFSNGERPTILVNDGNKVINSEAFYMAAPYKDPVIIYEDRDFLRPTEWVGVEFSRGCKFACKFCNFPILGVKGDYTRDASSFERQLRDAYDRFGTHRYHVTDETFNDATEKITKFANVVETLNFDPFFVGFVRPDLLVSRKQDREEMLRMNFLGHFYGVESLNNATLKVIGKGMDSQKLRDGLVDVKKYFKSNGTNRYRATLSLIAGLPHETEQSLKETEEWLLNNWVGENLLYFPFELSEEHEINNNSFLSINYSKYNYRRMDLDNVPSKFAWPWRTEYRRKNIVWENDYLNLPQVVDLTENFRKTYNHLFSVGAFGLASMMYESDLDILFDPPKAQFKLSTQKAEEFIKEYINFKLSL